MVGRVLIDASAVMLYKASVAAIGWLQQKQKPAGHAVLKSKWQKFCLMLAAIHCQAAFATKTMRHCMTSTLYLDREKRTAEQA